MDRMTDDELAGLSDAERAAMEEEESDTGADSADEEADVDAEKDEDGETEEVDGEEGEEGEGEDEPVAAEREPYVPHYKSEAPENAADLLAQISQEHKALRQKFSDGDIDLDEYEAQREQLDDQRLEIKGALLEARIAQKHTTQALQSYWETERTAFVERADNALYKSSAGKAAFNEAVQRLARIPENANQPASYFLREADKIVREELGIVRAEKKVVRKTGERAREALAKAPPDLGRAPSADLPETGDGGEFAHLEKLGGMELERALAKLSDEQQMRYLTS